MAIKFTGNSSKAKETKAEKEAKFLRRIRASWTEIFDVPERNITSEMISSVLSRHPKAIALIPRKRLTENLCRDAIHNFYVEKNIEIDYFGTDDGDTILNQVPLELRTERICKIALRKSEMELEHIPASVLTKSFWISAVADGLVPFEKMPKDLIDEESLSMILSCIPSYIKHLNRNQLTVQILKPALLADEGVIELIAPENWSEELIDFALEMDVCNIMKFADGVATEDRVIKAVSIYPHILDELDPDMITEKVAAEAVFADLSTVIDVPEEIIKNASETFKTELKSRLEKMSDQEMPWSSLLYLVETDNSYLASIKNHSKFSRLAEVIGIEVDYPVDNDEKPKDEENPEFC